MTTSIKTCFKCGAEKPLTDFYRHAAMADGHTHYDAPLCVVWLCQSCHVTLHKQFGDTDHDRN